MIQQNLLTLLIPKRTKGTKQNVEENASILVSLELRRDQDQSGPVKSEDHGFAKQTKRTMLLNEL